MNHVGAAMRTYWEMGTAAVLGGLIICGWWELRRRSWSVSRHDETMRRHVNQHYS